MTDFLQVAISSLGQGSVYALLALGLTLIYRSTTTVNFAHGALFMLGAFIALELMILGVPYLLAVVLAIVIMALLGWGIDKVAFEPLVKKEHVAQVFATIAVSFVITGVVRFFTVDQRGMAPIFGDNAYLRMGELTINTQHLAMIASLVVVSLALGWFFQRTRIGLVIRACTSNLRGADLVGINVKRVFAIMWSLGSALAALAGILVAPTLLVGPDIGNRPLVIGLAAMALGGFGSIPGALIGGLAMGLIEGFSGYYISTQLGAVAGLVVVLAVLVFRPNGLLGMRQTRVQAVGS
ncbi:MAG TPA: branched-chain amino acid ABC transporter permease [Microbacterium sp.]|jgi:branched-chain amino acid transport system permease protein|nr:branched-chain amino acid ABC transporter permease [Microbacterium sp.]